MTTVRIPDGTYGGMTMTGCKIDLPDDSTPTFKPDAQPLGQPPALPYAGTEGYSGSETSEERARTEAADGSAASRQAQVRRMLRVRGTNGMTVKEFREATGHHHGKASGTLSSMHKEGDIVRLSERRDRCEVYVLPGYVDGRATRSQGREKGVEGDSEVDTYLREWLGRDASAPLNSPAAWSKAGQDPKGFIRGLRALTGYGA